MRALFLCNSAFLGGAERYTVTVVRELSRRGHQIVVAAPEDSGVLLAARSMSGVTGLATALGPKLSKRSAVETALRWRSYRSGLRALLATAMDRYGVEVLHAQFKKEQLLASRLAASLGIPVVWTEHGPLPRALTALSPARALYRRSAVRTQRILCVSEAVQSDLLSHGVPPDRLELCYNGVDLSGLRSTVDRTTLRTRLGVGPDELVVGAVSRLVPLKGLTYLLDAIPSVTTAFDNARFVLVGDGPEQEALQRQARELGIWDRITFTGFREDVGDLLSAMDLFVTPTLAEGCPLSVMEAMSLAVPVVASGVGGIPEVLHQGAAGVLVPPRDTEALVVAIGDLLRDAPRRARLGEAGRARVRERFTVERMMDQTERVLQEATARSRSRRERRARERRRPTAPASFR